MKTATVTEADVIIVAARLRALNALKNDYGYLQHEKVRKALEALSSAPAQAPERCARCGRETKGEAAQVSTEVWCHSCADAQTPLTWLAEHKNHELSFSGWDEDPAWQVHSVTGGRNDREWTLRATGRTPDEALRKAMGQGDSQ